MARKKQQILNYRTSGSTNMPLSGDVQYGELVVRYDYKHPELLIKTNDSSQGSNIGDNFATFIDKNAIQALITGDTHNIEQKLEDLSGSTSAFSASVFQYYAKSGDTYESISNAYNYAVGVSGSVSALSASVFNYYATSTDTHTAINDVNTALSQTIRQTTSKLDDLSGSTSAFSASVFQNYAKSGDTYNSISNAYNYAAGVSGSVSAFSASVFKDYAKSADTYNSIYALGQEISTTKQGLEDLSASTSAFSASVVEMKSNLIDTIESALTVVYKFKGTVDDVDDLNEIENPKNGDVYNVVNAQGTIGESGYTPPGTNYAWVEDNAETHAGHWDALGGEIDLSNYVTQDQLTGATQDVTELKQQLSDLSGSTSAFSASVFQYYAKSGDTYESISNAYNYAVGVSGSVSAFSASVFENYAKSADTYNSIYAVGDDLKTTKESLEVLSASTSAFSASVFQYYAKSGDTYNSIANAYNYAAGVSGSVSAFSASVFEHYAKSADTYNTIDAINTKLTQDINNVQTDVDELSASTQTIEQTANKAINKFELSVIDGTPSSTQSGAKAMYVTGGTATLDLTELIIDCGDF